VTPETHYDQKQPCIQKRLAGVDFAQTKNEFLHFRITRANL